MLNYSTQFSSPYLLDFFTIDGSSISAGTNTFVFNNANKSLFAKYIDQQYNCVPLQFIVLNTSDQLYTLSQFTSDTKFWCDKLNFIKNEYTIAYSTDQNKANHTHVESITEYLGLKFSSPGIPGTGGLNIWVLFTAFKITKNQLI